MAIVASDVMDRSAALLNDPNKSLYTYTKQLPFLQQASDDLTDELAAHSVPTLREVSAVKSITAGTTDMTSTLPTDILTPTRLLERKPGQTDDAWLEMVKVSTLPQRTMGAALIHWVWREDMIYFVGATVNIEVKLYYTRIFTPIASSSSAIDMVPALSFLAARTAEHISYLSGADKDRARVLGGMAARALHVIVAREIRGMLPVRRKRFKPGLR